MIISVITEKRLFKKSLRLLRGAANLCNQWVGVSLVRTYLYKIDKPGNPAAVITRANASWEVLSAESVTRLSEFGSLDAGEALQRLRRGDLCYVAVLEGRLAHFTWVQRSGTHPILEAGMSVPVESGDFWIYNCRTVEWARGYAIYPATLVRIIDDHFEAGYCTAWIYTTRENIASQKGILRAGFGLVETFGALRVGKHYYRFGEAYQGQ
jgi:hypothetical protein